MKFQLAYGFIESLIDLLEKVIVTSCGIEYEHTFAMVNFGKKPNYKIILGHPFMHLLKRIQGWGYIYIYRRHVHATSRIDLKDHSYKDVVHTLVGVWSQMLDLRTLCPHGLSTYIPYGG